MIRVILVEDHTIVRKGLRSLLDDATDIDVVGEAETGHEAISKVDQLKPDVVVMDISMPILNGLEATRRIKENDFRVKVIMLTMHDNEEYILQSLRAGAEGYLVKQTAPSELVEAIRIAHQGGSYLSPSISKKVIQEYIRQANSSEQDSLERLTKREREVLQLIAEGHSTRQIAEMLFISEKTTRAHRSNVLKKLKLQNTAELTIYALQKGVIALEK